VVPVLLVWKDPVCLVWWANVCIVTATLWYSTGSVLGPILFLLYSAEVTAIARRFGVSVHGYADDLQLYDHTDPASCASLVQRLSVCVEAINDWMASSRLRLNPTKTELIWLGAPWYVRHSPMGPFTIAGALITPSAQVRDLGVMVDSDLSLNAHVNRVTSICYYHIRQLRPLRRCLSLEAAHALVRAFVHTHLDYCNGILAGAPQSLVGRLQSVLRAAARLVLRLPLRSSVAQAIRDRLHWLPFPQRVSFKLGVLVYKCVHSLAPPYLSQMCTQLAVVPGRARLRSTAAGHLAVPYTNMTTVGRRGFYYAAPANWNSLPSYLTDSNITFDTFKKQLKTFLFAQQPGGTAHL